jgi:hypothetical protein
MWSFYIRYKNTGERDIIFGYNWRDACRRSSLDPEATNIECLMQDYEG